MCFGMIVRNQKNGEKAKLVHIKTEHIYVDIAKDVETRSPVSSYELETLLPRRKDKKVIGLMTDELGEKVMAEFAALRSKTDSYLTDDNYKNKKAKNKNK